MKKKQHMKNYNFLKKKCQKDFEMQNTCGKWNSDFFSVLLEKQLPFITLVLDEEYY